MIKKSYTEKRVVSSQLRYGNKKQKEALEKFINRKKFDDRKPTPQEVITECLRKGGPMYGLIKTSVKHAAEAYWYDAAQNIIRHIEYVRIDVLTKKVLNKPVRAYLPLGREQFGKIPEDSYKPIPRVLENPAYQESILASMQADFLAWVDRWEKHVEFFKEFSEVTTAYKRIQQKLNKRIVEIQKSAKGKTPNAKTSA